jgi:pectate lyase
MREYEVSAGLPGDDANPTDVTPVVVSKRATLRARGVPQLPVPIGFGANATGGHKGKVLHVTSDTDDGAEGTLRWATAQSGPTWIVFEGDMTIALSEALPLTADTTVDGRGHQVVVSGHHRTSGLVINEVDNVVVESLTLRGFGNTDLAAEDNDPFDAISVVRAQRVWVDHNDLSQASDKTLGVGGMVRITVSGNHFHNQRQTLQLGSMHAANDAIHNQVTVTRNHFDHCAYRMPVVSYGKAHVFNNVMEAWEVYAVRSQRLAQTYLENNVFKPGDDATATLLSPGQISSDHGTNTDSRDGWLYDTGNLYLGKCKHPSTGKEHMFSPAEAYAYTAEEATLELAEQVAAEAGPV